MERLRNMNEEELVDDLKKIRMRNKKQEGEEYDLKKRELIYRIFEYKNKNNMFMKHFFRFFKASWIFINADNDNNGFITFQKLRDNIETYECPLPMTL